VKSVLTRTVTGLLFIAVIIASILLSNRVMLNVFLLFACVALYEYRSLLQQKIKLSVFFYIVSLSVYLLVSITELQSVLSATALLSIITGLFFLLFIVELFRRQEQAFQTIAYSVLGIMWIVLPFALINHFPLIRGVEGRFLLLSVFIIIWLYDTLAYCVGMLIGKHRLFERISPKKSWEGAIGSTLLTLTAVYFANVLFPMLPLTPMQWIGLAMVIIVFGTLGDLVESLFKRQLSVKDSGTILPGHGGVLDRFDSLLFAIPFVWFYLNIILN